MLFLVGGKKPQYQKRGWKQLVFMCNIDGVVLFNLIKVTLKAFMCAKKDVRVRFSHGKSDKMKAEVCDLGAKAFKCSEECVTVEITACTHADLPQCHGNRPTETESPPSQCSTNPDARHQLQPINSELTRRQGDTATYPDRAWCSLIQ